MSETHEQKQVRISRELVRINEEVAAIHNLRKRLSPEQREVILQKAKKATSNLNYTFHTDSGCDYVACDCQCCQRNPVYDI